MIELDYEIYGQLVAGKITPPTTNSQTLLMYYHIQQRTFTGIDYLTHFDVKRFSWIAWVGPI